MVVLYFVWLLETDNTAMFKPLSSLVPFALPCLLRWGEGCLARCLGLRTGCDLERLQGLVDSRRQVGEPG